MKVKIVLIGGGGHCHSCIDVIESTEKFEIVGILDKSIPNSQKILGYPVLGNDSLIPQLIKDNCVFAITAGQIKNPDVRFNLFNLVKKLGGTLPVIISPRSHVSKWASIGEATMILHDVVINANSKIGMNCIINTKALIEHDVQVGDHCHLSTGSIVNGNGTIGDKCFIGSNTTIKEGITISSGLVIGAGQFYRGDKN